MVSQSVDVHGLLDSRSLYLDVGAIDHAYHVGKTSHLQSGVVKIIEEYVSSEQHLIQSYIFSLHIVLITYPNNNY